MTIIQQSHSSHCHHHCHIMEVYGGVCLEGIMMSWSQEMNIVDNCWQNMIINASVIIAIAKIVEREKNVYTWREKYKVLGIV